jgi:hypothetical protein
MPLHGPQGEVNGALLEDGTVLRLPPPAAMTFAALLQTGQTIVAEGVEWMSALGKVMEVRQIGPSRTQLNWVAAASNPRGNKHPAHDPWAALATFSSLYFANLVPTGLTAAARSRIRGREILLA